MTMFPNRRDLVRQARDAAVQEQPAVALHLYLAALAAWTNEPTPAIQDRARVRQELNSVVRELAECVAGMLRLEGDEEESLLRFER